MKFVLLVSLTVRDAELVILVMNAVLIEIISIMYAHVNLACKKETEIVSI
jgi:hypothetical protein